MTTIRVSATKARNNLFELLNQVALGDTQVIIEKDSKEVAILAPKKQTVDWEGLTKASEAVHGIWKDSDTKLENLPTRQPGAWSRIGTWDKGMKWLER